ncbi:hypothetical protein COLO4_07267 [Corchorus olitorius]|uniref:Retrotransposon gag protein n=1 Tax=Corchorus olitorius TaxID=93759 RepID=A0A1R3KKL0_9ROSI|nr:hypothetical protein COLO4_07267 [Corchorus olitorius]
MGEGISTRTQKEIATLQSSFVELNAKVDTSIAQLRSEIQTNTEQVRSEMEKVSLDLKQFITQCFQKPPAPIDLASPSNAPGVLGPVTSATASHNSSSSNSSGDSNRSYTKHSKIQCPRFDGSDFVGWHHRILQFFEADSTPEHTKIRTVMMHLEGKALQWHLYFMRIAEASDAMSFFLINLKPEIAQQVRFSQPKTLAQSVNYARHVESLMNGSVTMPLAFKNFLNPNATTKQSTFTNRTNNRLPSLQTSTNTTQLLTYPTSKQTSPIEKAIAKTSYIPSKTERDERRKQGLCMWCATKYSPGHHCGVKAQLYQMFLEESAEDSMEQDAHVGSSEFIDDTVPAEDTDSAPIISLRALLGATGPQTMQIAAGEVKLISEKQASRQAFSQQSLCTMLLYIGKAQLYNLETDTNALSRVPQATLYAISTFSTNLSARIHTYCLQDPALATLIQKLQQDTSGQIAREPVVVLDRRIVKKYNKAVTQVLILWSNSFAEDATWETLFDIQQKFPTFNP